MGISGKRIFIIFFLVITIFISMVYGQEECLREQNQDDLPCTFLTAFPPANPCNAQNLTTFDFNGTILGSQSMELVGLSGRCNATFNFSTLGQYFANDTAGNTWNLTVVEGNLNFFNLLVYITFTIITFILIVFMHKFRDHAGTAIVYGWLATAISIITGAIISTPGFDVLRDVSLFFTLDTYLAFIAFAIAMYTALISINLYKDAHPKEADY